MRDRTHAFAGGTGGATTILGGGSRQLTSGDRDLCRLFISGMETGAIYQIIDVDGEGWWE
ncbi:hypothetical protein GCM10007989_23590 [Devosia pacifica]|uniref:Uncharacterized protein n=1 Tax=Devosia pacifica TaxID=1335967 RepID=A0A918S760_9HYPH|nr:hypothetical protein [Devosia pacifica]GHA27046.1 hypothetical protein GCM10007989_23590 [Devosia pacifica]